MNRAERTTLLAENLPLVGYLVSEVCSKALRVSRDNLAVAGTLALASSADSHDPSLGIPFTVYARGRITAALSRDLATNDWAPDAVHRRIGLTLAVQQALTAALGREPALEETAAALGVDNTTAKELLADPGSTGSSRDDALAGFIIADMPASAEAELLAAQRLRYLRSAIENLPATLRHIIEQVHLHGQTMAEVALQLGLDPSVISQQRSEAIRLLADGLRQLCPERTATSRQDHTRPSTAPRSAYLAATASRLSLLPLL